MNRQENIEKNHAEINEGMKEYHEEKNYLEPKVRELILSGKLCLDTDHTDLPIFIDLAENGMLKVFFKNPEQKHTPIPTRDYSFKLLPEEAEKLLSDVNKSVTHLERESELFGGEAATALKHSLELKEKLEEIISGK